MVRSRRTKNEAPSSRWRSSTTQSTLLSSRISDTKHPPSRSMSPIRNSINRAVARAR